MDDESRDFKVGPKKGLIMAQKKGPYTCTKGVPCDISASSMYLRKGSGLWVDIFREMDVAEPIKKCQKICSSYKYFALQSKPRIGSECFCDNSYATPASTYIKKPDGECRICHAKYGAQLWGGPLRNAVYRNSNSTTPDKPHAAPATTEKPPAASEQSFLSEAAKYHSFNSIQAVEKPAGESLPDFPDCAKFATPRSGACATQWNEGFRDQHSALSPDDKNTPRYLRKLTCTQCKEDQAFVLELFHSSTGSCHAYNSKQAGTARCLNLHPKYNVYGTGISTRYKNRMCTKFQRLKNNLSVGGNALGNSGAADWFNKDWGSKTSPIRGSYNYVEATCDARKEVVCLGSECSVRKSIRCKEICAICSNAAKRHPWVGADRSKWNKFARPGHVWCLGPGGYHDRRERKIVENIDGSSIAGKGVSLKKLNELWKHPRHWPTKGPKWENGNPNSIGAPFIACSTEICKSDRRKGEWGDMACKDAVVLL